MNWSRPGAEGPSGLPSYVVTGDRPARIHYAQHQHPDLSIDHRLALRTAATRLQADFAEHFGVETIERFLHTSYDQFAGRAAVPNFLPLLVERFARQRLNALAWVEGKNTDSKPTVLFLCTHNVPLHPQRTALPNGAGILRSPCWRAGRRVVWRIGTRQ
jgi:hypothetical protein